MALTKIVSGGQTGADRAGLAAGKALGLETGGWLPRGCWTEDGPMPSLVTEYGMKEHPSSGYPPRTKANVEDSDGTVLFGNMGSPGCSLTIRLCLQLNRVYFPNPTPAQLDQFVTENEIQILNVAGNRESTNPGI